MYMPYFGFCREPFARDISADKIYQSDAHKEFSMRFNHMLEHRGLMLLTGESGAGKTTAIRSLIAALNTKQFYPIYLPLATVGVSDFYRQLNAALGGEQKFFKTALYRSIQERLTNFAAAKHLLPVIVLDEAHLLKDQNLRELQLIVNFKMDTVTPALFVLAGQSYLRKRLESPMLESIAQRIVLSYQLPSLGEEETAAYIRYHLEYAGLSVCIVNEKACRVIAQFSNGLPRKIGAITLNALRYAAIKKEKVIDENIIFLAAKEVI